MSESFDAASPNSVLGNVLLNAGEDPGDDQGVPIVDGQGRPVSATAHRQKRETGAQRIERELDEGVERVRERLGIAKKEVHTRRVDPATLRPPAEQKECARCGFDFAPGEPRRGDDAYFDGAQIHPGQEACDRARIRAEQRGEVERIQREREAHAESVRRARKAQRGMEAGTAQRRPRAPDVREARARQRRVWAWLSENGPASVSRIWRELGMTNSDVKTDLHALARMGCARDTEERRKDVPGIKGVVPTLWEALDREPTDERYADKPHPGGTPPPGGGRTRLDLDPPGPSVHLDRKDGEDNTAWGVRIRRELWAWLRLRGRVTYDEAEAEVGPSAPRHLHLLVEQGSACVVDRLERSGPGTGPGPAIIEATEQPPWSDAARRLPGADEPQSEDDRQREIEEEADAREAERLADLAESQRVGGETGTDLEITERAEDADRAAEEAWRELDGLAPSAEGFTVRSSAVAVPQLDGDASPEAFRRAYLQLLLARAAVAPADDPILDRVERIAGVPGDRGA